MSHEGNGQQSRLRTYWVLGPEQQKTAGLTPGLTPAGPWNKSLIPSKPQFPPKRVVTMERGPLAYAQPGPGDDRPAAQQRGPTQYAVCDARASSEGSAASMEAEGGFQEGFLKEVTPELSPEQ